MRDVWGWEFGDQSTVTVHVRRLREKIEDDPGCADAARDGVGGRLPVGPGAGLDRARPSAGTYRGDA